MTWKPIDTAPKDGTTILLLTADFGAVEGFWNKDVENFYGNWEYANRPPDAPKIMGDWWSDWTIGEPTDHRLFCGCTPKYWRPLLKDPKDPDIRDRKDQWK